MNCKAISGDSNKSYVDDFMAMMDEMLSSYTGDEWIVFQSVGLNKEDYHNVRFEHKHMRNALDFYLKEINKEITYEQVSRIK